MGSWLLSSFLGLLVMQAHGPPPLMVTGVSQPHGDDPQHPAFQGLFRCQRIRAGASRRAWPQVRTWAQLFPEEASADILEPWALYQECQWEQNSGG